MISMDGYYKGEGDYEVITHGGQPCPDALCSLIIKDSHHNIEVRGLLNTMVKGVERFIEEDNHRYTVESINRALQEEGYEPLGQCVIDVILTELEFQKASEVDESEGKGSVDLASKTTFSDI